MVWEFTFNTRGKRECLLRASRLGGTAHIMVRIGDARRAGAFAKESAEKAFYACPFLRGEEAGPLLTVADRWAMENLPPAVRSQVNLVVR
jgi:hypothetical protein